ncbi:unnamed protein product [Caenorhabditis nigoni]
MSCRAVSVLSKCRISQQQIRGKAHSTFQPSQTLPAALQLVNRKMTARTTSSPFGSHQIRNYAVRLDEFNFTVIPDIKENDLKRLGEDFGIPNLSTGTFPKDPFPVNGKIYGPNNRAMVPLLCRHHSNKDTEGRYVWFLVHTGTPYTFLSAKSMKALIGQGFEGDPHSFSIQDESTQIDCYTSRENFSDVNVLGVGYMRAMKLSVKFDWNNKTCELIQN